MFNTNPTAARQALSDQILTLDTMISKVTKICNSPTIKTCSFFFSGVSSIKKEYNEIVIWDRLPIPTERIREFFSSYGTDLIASRNLLVEALEQSEKEVRNDY